MDRYLESLKFLWRRRSQSRETPVIINTMGWVKGQQETNKRHEKMSNLNGDLNAVARVIRRVWISAAGGHDPLFPSFTCGAAGPQWGRPVSHPHARVSEDGARLPDSPARADGLG